MADDIIQYSFSCAQSALLQLLLQQKQMNDWVWAWCFVIGMFALITLCFCFSPVIGFVVWFAVECFNFIIEFFQQLWAFCRNLMFRICTFCTRSKKMKMINNNHSNNNNNNNNASGGGASRSWSVILPRAIFEFSPRLYVVNVNAETSTSISTSTSSSKVVSSCFCGDKSSESDVIVPVDLLR